MASVGNSNAASGRAGIADEYDNPTSGDEVHQDTRPLTELETVTQLAKTIEGEIIPRLLLSHRIAEKPVAIAPVSIPAPHHFTAEEVAAFAHATYAPGSKRCFAMLTETRALAIPLESIILNLLSPAAKYLGEMWKSDHCTFTEVTVGLSRLRQMLKNISQDFEHENAAWKHGRRALLLPTPGEQHTFGLFVVESFFRREGWDVWAAPVESEQELRDLVGGQWFAVAGISLHSERFRDRLAPSIKAVRESSLNKDIGVLVGGLAFLENPGLAAEVGADAGAIDARYAVMEAKNVLSRVGTRTRAG